MRETPEMVVETSPVAICSGAVKQVLLVWFLDSRSMRMLKNVRSGRFDTHGISDWQLIKDRGNCLQQRRREQLFILRR